LKKNKKLTGKYCIFLIMVYNIISKTKNDGFLCISIKKEVGATTPTFSVTKTIYVFP